MWRGGLMQLHPKLYCSHIYCRYIHNKYIFSYKNLDIFCFSYYTALMIGTCFFSPSQGPCCTAQCSYKDRSQKCREESDCAKMGICNGFSAQCPPSEPRENLTECNRQTQVCIKGVNIDVWKQLFVEIEEHYLVAFSCRRSWLSTLEWLVVNAWSEWP